MTRLILTFETLFQVLSAEKMLTPEVKCRPVPTPAGLGSSICGISVELLEPEQRGKALQVLADKSLPPQGVHEIP